jgi:hypothetical protein
MAFSTVEPHSGFRAEEISRYDLRKNYEKLNDQVAEKKWKHVYDLSKHKCACEVCDDPATCELKKRTRAYNILTGSVIPFWKTIKSYMVAQEDKEDEDKVTFKVVRVESKDNRRLVGILIPNENADKIQQQILLDARELLNSGAFSGTVPDLLDSHEQQRKDASMAIASKAKQEPVHMPMLEDAMESSAVSQSIHEECVLASGNSPAVKTASEMQGENEVRVDAKMSEGKAAKSVRNISYAKLQVNADGLRDGQADNEMIDHDSQTKREMKKIDKGVGLKENKKELESAGFWEDDDEQAGDEMADHEAQTNRELKDIALLSSKAGCLKGNTQELESAGFWENDETGDAEEFFRKGLKIMDEARRKDESLRRRYIPSEDKLKDKLKNTSLQGRLRKQTSRFVSGIMRGQSYVNDDTESDYGGHTQTESDEDSASAKKSCRIRKSHADPSSAPEGDGRGFVQRNRQDACALMIDKALKNDVEAMNIAMYLVYIVA